MSDILLPSLCCKSTDVLYCYGTSEREATSPITYSMNRKKTKGLPQFYYGVCVEKVRKSLSDLSGRRKMVRGVGGG